MFSCSDARVAHSHGKILGCTELELTGYSIASCGLMGTALFTALLIGALSLAMNSGIVSESESDKKLSHEQDVEEPRSEKSRGIFKTFAFLETF